MLFAHNQFDSFSFFVDQAIRDQSWDIDDIHSLNVLSTRNENWKGMEAFYEEC